MTLYEALQNDKRQREEAARLVREQAMTALVAASRPSVTIVDTTPVVYGVTPDKAMRLKFSIEEAGRDIDNLEQDLEDLNHLFDLATEEAELYRHRGDTPREAKAIRQVRNVRNQINRAEKALARAKFSRAEAMSKLYA